MNTCLKCKSKYHDREGEDYLCDACLIDKKAIADEIDKKYNTRGQKPTGIRALEEEIAKKGGFAQSADGKNSRLLININDLGIKL
jgi:hypothetical protein